MLRRQDARRSLIVSVFCLVLVVAHASLAQPPRTAGQSQAASYFDGGFQEDIAATSIDHLSAVDDLVRATSGKKGRSDTLQDLGQGEALEIRKDAMREAALSYGARAALAKRSSEIMDRLRGKEFAMNQVFNFDGLLIRAPSGMLIEPPIISRADEALLITDRGQEAAVADRIYKINQQAQIVPAARRWEDYLVMGYGMVKVAPPPKILWPENAEEKRNWAIWIKAGWDDGIRQADEIFQDNLHRLMRDFNGMVRYRLLLAQGMISEPFALHEDRGVTGTGTEMRVGDRAIRITGPSQFRIGADQWQPADR